MGFAHPVAGSFGASQERQGGSEKRVTKPFVCGTGITADKGLNQIVKTRRLRSPAVSVAPLAPVARPVPGPGALRPVGAPAPP